MNQDSNVLNIVPRINSLLDEYFYKSESEHIKNINVVRLISRPFSSVIQLKVETQSSTKELVLKNVNHHPMIKSKTKSLNQAVVEYDILKKLHPKFEKVVHCSVPRPILVIPEEESYIMEYINGSLLMDDDKYMRYFSSLKNFNLLKQLYFYTGKWLRNFQKFTETKSSGIEILEGVIQRCEHRLNLIEQSNNPLCPSDLRVRVLDLIENQKQQILDEKIISCGRHGDFGPWNIIYNDDGVTVIDFLGYTSEPMMVDLLKMMIFFEDEKMSLSSDSGRVQTLGSSFIKGFGQIPQISLPAIKICEAMQRVVSIWGNITKQKRHIHHKYEANRRIRNHVHWLTDKHEFQSCWPSNNE